MVSIACVAGSLVNFRRFSPLGLTFKWLFWIWQWENMDRCQTRTRGERGWGERSPRPLPLRLLFMWPFTFKWSVKKSTPWKEASKIHQTACNAVWWVGVATPNGCCLLVGVMLPQTFLKLQTLWDTFSSILRCKLNIQDTNKTEIFY